MAENSKEDEFERLLTRHQQKYYVSLLGVHVHSGEPFAPIVCSLIAKFLGVIPDTQPIGTRNKADEHKKIIVCTIFSPDDTFCVTGSMDKTIKIWDVQTGGCLATLRGHKKTVNAVVLASDLSCLASCSDDKTVKTWPLNRTIVPDLDMDAKAPKVEKPKPKEAPKADPNEELIRQVLETGMGFSRNAIRRALLDIKFANVHSVVAWLLENGEKPGINDPLPGDEPAGQKQKAEPMDVEDTHMEIVPNLSMGGEHKYGIRTLALSPDDSLAITGSLNKETFLWDLRQGKKIAEFKGHTSAVLCSGFTRDGVRVATGSYDKTAIIWETATGKIIHKLGRTPDSHRSVVKELQWFRNDELLMTGSGDTTLKIWDTQSGTVLQTFQGHTNSVNCFGLSTKAQVLVSGGDDMTLKFWDVATGAVKSERVLGEDNEGEAGDSISVLALSSDSEFVLTSINNHLQVYTVDYSNNVALF